MPPAHNILCPQCSDEYAAPNETPAVQIVYGPCFICGAGVGPNEGARVGRETYRRIQALLDDEAEPTVNPEL